MKKIIIALLIVLMTSCGVFAAASTQTITVESNSVKIKVNGTQITADNFVYNGTTYVPLRAVSENMGMSVGWDQGTNTASIVSDRVALLNQFRKVITYASRLESMSRTISDNPYSKFKELKTEIFDSYNLFVDEYYRTIKPHAPEKIGNSYDYLCGFYDGLLKNADAALTVKEKSYTFTDQYYYSLFNIRSLSDAYCESLYDDIKIN